MLVNCLTQVNDDSFLKSEADFWKNTQQILALRGRPSSTSRHFWLIWTPSPCHTLSHIPGPPKVRHTSRTPQYLVGLIHKSRTKVPCTKFISIVRGGFCPGGFVRVGF